VQCLRQLVDPAARFLFRYRFLPHRKLTVDCKPLSRQDAGGGISWGDSMTEAAVIAAFATLGQAFLAGLQASFAIISAYKVALYFFLGRAPLAMRVLAFAFFSATLAVLGVYLACARAYGDGSAVELAELQTRANLSTLGRVVLWLVNHPQAYALLYASLGIGLAGYLARFLSHFLLSMAEVLLISLVTEEGLGKRTLP
jgi:hypothetical protein